MTRCDVDEGWSDVLDDVREQVRWRKLDAETDDEPQPWPYDYLDAGAFDYS